MKKLSQKRLADTILNGRKQKGLTQQKLAELDLPESKNSSEGIQ